MVKRLVAGATIALVVLAGSLVDVRAEDGDVGTAMIAGRANYADTSFGPNYLAIRAKRGTLVRICGAGACQILRSTDYGPAKRTGDIADIALVRFAQICGWSVEKAARMGECDIELEFLDSVKLPETDVVGEWTWFQVPDAIRWPFVILWLIAYVAFKRILTRRFGR